MPATCRTRIATRWVHGTVLEVSSKVFAVLLYCCFAVLFSAHTSRARHVFDEETREYICRALCRALLLVYFVYINYVAKSAFLAYYYCIMPDMWGLLRGRRRSARSTRSAEATRRRNSLLPRPRSDNRYCTLPLQKQNMSTVEQMLLLLLPLSAWQNPANPFPPLLLYCCSSSLCVFVVCFVLRFPSRFLSVDFHRRTPPRPPLRVLSLHP